MTAEAQKLLEAIDKLIDSMTTGLKEWTIVWQEEKLIVYARGRTLKWTTPYVRAATYATQPTNYNEYRDLVRAHELCPNHRDKLPVENLNYVKPPEGGPSVAEFKGLVATWLATARWDAEFDVDCDDDVDENRPIYGAWVYDVPKVTPHPSVKLTRCWSDVGPRVEMLSPDGKLCHFAEFEEFHVENYHTDADHAPQVVKDIYAGASPAYAAWVKEQQDKFANRDDAEKKRLAEKFNIPYPEPKE